MAGRCCAETRAGGQTTPINRTPIMGTRLVFVMGYPPERLGIRICLDDGREQSKGTGDRLLAGMERVRSLLGQVRLRDPGDVRIRLLRLDRGCRPEAGSVCAERPGPQNVREAQALWRRAGIRSDRKTGTVSLGPMEAFTVPRGVLHQTHSAPRTVNVASSKPK